MYYLKEVYRWDTKNGLNYYHLSDSSILKDAIEGSFHENDSLICIIKIEEDEVQNTRNRK